MTKRGCFVEVEKLPEGLLHVTLMSNHEPHEAECIEPSDLFFWIQNREDFIEQYILMRFRIWESPMGGAIIYEACPEELQVARRSGRVAGTTPRSVSAALGKHPVDPKHRRWQPAIQTTP